MLTVNASGIRGDCKAVLPFPALMLCSVKQGAERFEFMGCCCARLEGRGCLGPGLSHTGLSSALRGQETLKMQREIRGWSGSVCGVFNTKAC